jgi:hypothetical protein
MAGIANQIQNWASFTTIFEAATADLVAFAGWTNGTNNRFAFVGWTTEAAATVQNDTTTFGPQIAALDYSGTIAVYQPSDEYVAPFIMGAIASVDFTQTEGRITSRTRASAGACRPGVTDQQTLTNLDRERVQRLLRRGHGQRNFTLLSPGPDQRRFQVGGQLHQSDLPEQRDPAGPACRS